MSEETKVCSKCGYCKPLEMFPNDKRNKDGTAGDCRDCRAAKTRAWRDSNREHLLAYAKTEKALARNRRWKVNHKERMSEYRAKWYLENRAHSISYSSKYYAENQEYVAKRLDKRKADSATLHKSYIRRILSNSGINPKEAPNELIELKRDHIQLVRLTRKIKKEIANV